MPKLKKHSGSALSPIANTIIATDTAVETELVHVGAGSPKQLLIIEDGVEIQQTKSYGVGIDCHSKFIQVSVILKRDLRCYEYRREFRTDWVSLTEAREWIIAIINTYASPRVDISLPLHYCIESTSTYHIPVIMAFGGTPSIVNPQIAGATKRKTDVLDAKMLALHNLTGVWAESFIPSIAVQELRLLIAERNNYKRMASRTSNRINNGILRFGFTVGQRVASPEGKWYEPLLKTSYQMNHPARGRISVRMAYQRMFVLLSNNNTSSMTASVNKKRISNVSCLQKLNPCHGRRKTLLSTVPN